MSEFVVPPVIDPLEENEDLRALAEWIDSLEPEGGAKHLPGQHDQLDHGVRGRSPSLGEVTPGETPHGRYNTRKLNLDLEKILYEFNDPSLSGTWADDGAAHLKAENVKRIGAALAERAKKDPALKAQLEQAADKHLAGSPLKGMALSEEGLLEITGEPSVYQLEHLHLTEGMTAAEVGGREVAAKMQDSWMQSASDDSELSWGMQLAAAERLGVDDSAARAVIARFSEPGAIAEDWFWDVGSEIGLPPFGGGPSESVDRVANSPAVKAYVDLVYADTQKYLADRDIDEISVYRGVHLSERLFAGTDRETTLVTLNPLSSTSTSETTAENFAQHDADVGDWGYVLRMTVPADRVFALPTTGPGCLSETELLIAGGQVRAEVVEQR